MSLDNFNITLDNTQIGQQHGLSLKHSSMKGDSLHGAGLFHLSDDSQAQIDAIKFAYTAHPELIDSSLIAHSLQDDSQLSYAGQSGIVADKYRHTGFVRVLPQGSDKKNTLYVQAKAAELEGGGALENVVYDIEHFSDAAKFVAGLGKYAKYQVNKSLSLVTKDDVSLSHSIARECDISVKAASIVSSFEYDKAYRLSFMSTQGDITLNNNLKALNIYATSARHIFENGVAYASDKLFFDAQGNIENRAYIGSGKYTQLLAKGNVLNLCKEQAYQGQYDSRRYYQAGVIAGGTGADTDGIGLYIKADGRVIAEASDFISQGINYIEGKKGVDFKAKYHVYTSLQQTQDVHCGDKHKSRWNILNDAKLAWDKVRDKKIQTLVTDTDIGTSHVYSGSARNIIRSGEGEVTSIAAQFVSPEGTDVYARGDVKLYGLKTNNRVLENVNYRLDWFDAQRDHVYQSSQPTLCLDNGTTRIHSAEGNIDARGAYFIGSGNIEMRAKKRIIWDVDVLNHDMTEKSRSLEWSIPGMGAWDSYKRGGRVGEVGAAFDPSLGKMRSLYHSQSGSEQLANTTNLGIDLANTGNNLMRGMTQGTMKNELLARYGLGHDGHFSPSVTLSYTQKKTKTQFQTQGQGGIQRGGHAVFIAGEGIDIGGGDFHVDGNMEFNTPSLIVHGKPLHSTTHQTAHTESFGIVGAEGIQSLGLSVNKTNTSSTHYINTILSAGGNMSLHHNGGKMQKCILNTSNLQSQSWNAKIVTLTVQDQQDTRQTKTQSLSLSTTCQVGFYQGKSDKHTTTQHSGIHVIEGINSKGHEVEVDKTHMIGGKITTDGVNHFKTGQLIAESLPDTEDFHGLGLSGNPHDLGRAFGHKPSDTAGEPLIASLAFQMDANDYVAMQIPVIYGREGTKLDTPNVQGGIVTQHPEGAIVIKNHHTHFAVDIPLTNELYLKNAQTHVSGAEDRLNTLLHPKPFHHDPVDFGRPEPIVPVKEDAIDTALHRSRRRKNRKVSSRADEHIDPISDAKAPVFTNAQKNPKNQNTTAVATLAEAYGGAVFEEMAKGIDANILEKTSHSNISKKEHLKGGKHVRKLGGLWSLGMNSELALLDDNVAKEDTFKKGAALTVVDACIDWGIKAGLKKVGLAGAAPPVAAGLLISEVADVFYDEETIQHIRQQGVDNLEQAQDYYRHGRFFSSLIMQRAAVDKIAFTTLAEAGHKLINKSNVLADSMVAGFNTLLNKNEPEQSNHIDLPQRP
ncbi:MAG: hypothetical protein CK424_07070 [Legionella sp.]|nr:MAG: hypothetical protein CK424_07070 [Legionella sp.]